MTEAIASLRLSGLAKPRQSAFGRGQSDTVAEIADLPKLDARTFFAETYITEGMGVLLRQVFDRLMARSDQGVFRLKQAMGGGKTHNLLAAALLQRHFDFFSRTRARARGRLKKTQRSQGVEFRPCA